MKKRALCIVLAAVLLLGLSMSAFAAQSDISIVIDNKEVQFSESSGDPFVDDNGRTQVPLRVVMEQYGYEVEWDSANNAAVITKDETTVIVPIGQSYITVNGERVPMIYKGTAYTPEYDISSDGLIADLSDEGMAFFFNVNEEKMYNELDGKVFYKGRTWQTVTLTKDNWLDWIRT